MWQRWAKFVVQLVLANQGLQAHLGVLVRPVQRIEARKGVEFHLGAETRSHRLLLFAFAVYEKAEGVIRAVQAAGFGPWQRHTIRSKMSIHGTREVAKRVPVKSVVPIIGLQ